MTAKLSKTRVDRLGDRLRQGSPVEADLRMLDDYRRSFGEAYETVVGTIREQLRLEATGRPSKSTSSIIEKLHRESIRLSQMQDIAGCRVLVAAIAEQERVVTSLREDMVKFLLERADVTEQERIVTSLQDIFPGASVVDRRRNPSYGYRGVHVIARSSGKLIEIQVRTPLQHLWAELSEKLSDMFDPTIKYGGGEDKIRELLAGFSELVEDYEQSEQKLAREYERQIREERRKKMRKEWTKNKEKVTQLLDEAISWLDS